VHDTEVHLEVRVTRAFIVTLEPGSTCSGTLWRMFAILPFLLSTSQEEYIWALDKACKTLTPKALNCYLIQYGIRIFFRTQDQ
jgi:hypothetical protein